MSNDLTPKENLNNILKILNFATKQNFQYINQIKNIEITLSTLLKKLKTSTTDSDFLKSVKKFEKDLGSYSFAQEHHKKQLLMDIYDCVKRLDLSKKRVEVINKNGDLSIFFKPLKELTFLSSTIVEKLEKKSINNVMDLLYNIPKKYEDYTQISPIDSRNTNKDIQVVGTVKSKRYVTGKRKYMEIVIATNTKRMKVILFHYKQVGYLFKIDNQYLLRGTLHYNNYFSYHMIHPKLFQLNDNTDINNYLTFSLKYGDIGVSDHIYSEIIEQVLKSFKNDFIDFLPNKFVKENNFVSLYQNFIAIHGIEKEGVNISLMNDQQSIYHERLKFEEFFLLHLSHLLKKTNLKDKKGIKIPINFEIHQKFIKTLPFELTDDQLKSISDLFEDLRSGYPTNRLIQGDVGSGKTVVALSAMLQAIKAGYQAIIMVPTEILARQHHQNLTKMMEPFGVEVQLLISKMKKSVKDTIFLQLQYGSPQIYVGTHALIQKQVKYKNPALVVIDEQHRFGVLQRKTLQDIAKGINVVLLSATPIPRTLSMGIFGDLDITYIETMPKRRKPVKTFAMSEDRLPKVFKFLREQVAKGEQGYVIFPLIEDSEALQLKSLESNYETYKEKYFPDIEVGMLHGKMKSEEKDQIMKDFQQKKIDILFATTVVEVGIDVQNATVMVIMNGERFGLSQLHQLRGRVGRGEKMSYCFLISPKDDVKRLKILESSTNGFVIAREDLKLRGPGDIYGVDQSGVPKFRFISFDKDETIILRAGQAADRYMKYDPNLEKESGLKKYITLLKENSYWNIS